MSRDGGFVVDASLKKQKKKHTNIRLLMLLNGTINIVYHKHTFYILKYFFKSISTMKSVLPDEKC